MNYESIFARVEKPARYTGGEYNTPIIKDAEVSFLMCFPDVYEVAMSNLGIRILYYLLNGMEGISCERCFAPWHDMAAELRAADLPLFSLENRKPMQGFDIVGFSLQYELSYSNVLYMLDLGKIPFKRKDRDNAHPLIIAGGPCTVNPEPLYDIIDLFVVGDGEEVTAELANLYRKVKREGGSKQSFLEQAAKIVGVYVPDISTGVKRAIVKDLNTAFFPSTAQVSNIEAIHDRPNLEIFRGCIRGCRFCQAGFIYRPLRERELTSLVETGKGLILSTGCGELSVTSLSTGDYPRLSELISAFKDFNHKHRAKLSLPSLRLDSFEGEYTGESRNGSLTFAPEAGTQRLRNVINKNITDADIEKAVTMAFKQGYSSLKLYFIIGLPTETLEDLQGIVDIGKRVRAIYREITGRKSPKISVSAAVFIPKPFTPFQLEQHIYGDAVREKTFFLKTELNKIGVKFSYHDTKVSKLETVFARGDRKLSDVLISAYRRGAYFDGWSECFRIERYEDAFRENNIQLEDYLLEIPEDAPLPWDYVDVGVTKQFLLRERKRAYSGETTPDCRTKCSGCGLKC